MLEKILLEKLLLEGWDCFLAWKVLDRNLLWILAPTRLSFTEKSAFSEIVRKASRINLPSRIEHENFLAWKILARRFRFFSCSEISCLKNSCSKSAWTSCLKISCLENSCSRICSEFLLENFLPEGLGICSEFVLQLDCYKQWARFAITYVLVSWCLARHHRYKQWARFGVTCVSGVSRATAAINNGRDSR